MVCLRNISINTLHKGDDDYDDDDYDNSNNNSNNEEGDVTVLWNQAVHTDREVN